MPPAIAVDRPNRLPGIAMNEVAEALPPALCSSIGILLLRGRRH